MVVMDWCPTHLLCMYGERERGGRKYVLLQASIYMYTISYAAWTRKLVFSSKNPLQHAAMHAVTNLDDAALVVDERL